MAPEKKHVEMTDSDGNRWSGTVEKDDFCLTDMLADMITQTFDSITDPHWNSKKSK